MSETCNHPIAYTSEWDDVGLVREDELEREYIRRKGASSGSGWYVLPFRFCPLCGVELPPLFPQPTATEEGQG